MSPSSCRDSLAQDVVYCREEQSALYLELGHVSLYYFEYDSAKVHMCAHTHTHTQDIVAGDGVLFNQQMWENRGILRRPLPWLMSVLS